MTTLHGSPLPKDFEDGNPLTAAEFNAVKNYWVTNELPEYDPDDPDSVEIQDGDVVFVIGDKPVGGAPGAAVIDSAVADDPDNYPVKTSSFTGDGTNGEDGQNYDVYEFLGSGTLNVLEPGVVDALLVGGGGGTSYWGGGGAGGVNLLDNAYLPQANMQVVIGNGGVYRLSDEADSGGTSSIAPIPVDHLLFSVQGGAGSRNTPSNTLFGKDGASGAGAGSYNAVTTSGGQGILGIGNNGGGTQNNAGGAGGGGGGAGGAGADCTSSTFAGDGGPARIVTIAGAELHFGGGGGGGSNSIGRNGKGGEGAGDGGHYTTPPTPCDPNRGGGAGGTSGGAGSIYAGGNGGSGIVIVRVKVATKSFGPRTQSTTPKTAHAARIENGVVRQVIVIPHLNDDDNKITEYCNKIGLPGTWVDTSYTGARRGKYAGVGDLFDLNTRNAEFISPVVEEENNE